LGDPSLAGSRPSLGVVRAVASELVPRPHAGRVFEQIFRPGFADCAPSGRMRLDALARWLQDVAYADVVEADLADRAVWVVRRTRIRAERFPRFGEEFLVGTFCSGMGRMWAERRTSIVRLGEDEPGVEAVSLWVHLDPATWRPTPLSDEEIALYGTSGADRRVSARLRHPPPPADGRPDRWEFRASELDIAGHINNAAYWQPLEEQLLEGVEPIGVDAEVEYRTPAQPGEKRLVREGGSQWIVGPDGVVHSSAVIAEVTAG
jgi:acyl-ACP thioesterase